ncbi:hypothetical protein MASR1M65_21320 [Saprospiraceae bacterium]
MWMFGYLTHELGIPVHKQPIMKTFFGKKYFISCSSELLMIMQIHQKVLPIHSVSSYLQDYILIFFRTFNYWSAKSRNANTDPDHFLGKDREWLVQFCKETLATQHYDAFIFGHRHLPIDFYFTKENSRYVNLGDWIRYNTFAVINADGIELHSWEKDTKIFCNRS